MCGPLCIGIKQEELKKVRPASQVTAKFRALYRASAVKLHG